MYLQTLRLVQFKNYDAAQLQFNAKLNALVGNNGMGKTNILDAIHYVCVCKSHFNNLDKWTMQQGGDFFRLESVFINDADESEEVVCKYSVRTKKIVEHNRVPYVRLADHVGRFPVVFIAPDDTELLTESSEQRRQFMDFTLSQLDKVYLRHLIQYNKVIEQRNALLKSDNFDHALLDVYDAQLYEPAQYIYHARQELFQRFIPIFQSYYTSIAGNAETVGIAYESGLQESTMRALLHTHRRRDAQLQRTTQGIHRDDLVFTLFGQPVKRIASQGQRKSYLLALKLAQYELLRQQHNVAPLLLLDDIFDKLDANRVQQLLELLIRHDFGQIFITDTDQNRLESVLQRLAQPYALFRVSDGVIQTA